jgi:predicted acyltransferase
LSFLLLALFHAVIDVAQIKKWAFFFVVIGANALLAYMFSPIFDQVGDSVVALLSPYWPELCLVLAGSLTEVGLLWLTLWLLYRHRMFLRA